MSSEHMKIENGGARERGWKKHRKWKKGIGEHRDVECINKHTPAIILIDSISNNEEDDKNV